ncbi:MAG: hypothetical protein BGO70_02260 [Bacteroidetes bacterium 43-93]|nr:response regulator transcription factor [Bacteroidota bacterium]OJW99120.1 MAG: hypothetical protein BGO70_02260 [Bacteroidetes bacterium 43-93]
MKNHFSCIIVDDEPQAVELLSDAITMVNKNIEITGTYTSWPGAFEALRSQAPDLVFLDISIQGRNGMDLLKGIQEINSEIIFVTAYSDHALNAFKFPVSGYLLKPIDDVDLAAAIDRALLRIKQKKQVNKPGNIPSIIGIPDNKSINYINVNNIIYLEANNSYTSVITTTSTITSAYNLGKFREILDGQYFYQIHRSYIINLNHVKRYETSGSVIMDNHQELPVAKTARNEFVQFFVQVKADDTKITK